MKDRLVIVLMFVAALTLGLGGVAASAQDVNRRSFAGTVYTMSNATSGNAILVFDQLADGQLVRAGSVATGGTGTGSGLGNQGGLVLSVNERWLLAVNPGSNTVSVLEVQPHGLRLTDVEASGGVQPISVTEHGGVVYVVNAGSDNIAGFTLGGDGRLLAGGWGHSWLHGWPGYAQAVSDIQ